MELHNFPRRTHRMTRLFHPGSLGALPLGARQAPSARKDRRGFARRGVNAALLFASLRRRLTLAHPALGEGQGGIRNPNQTQKGETMTSTFTTTNAANLNTVMHGGDCVEIVRHMRPDGHSRPKWRGGRVGERPPLLR
jgi:hypothetical protein